MDRKEFVESMAEPDAPNVMDFVVRRNADAPEDRTFSAEALARITEEMAGFVGARTLGRWTKTGKPPHALRARVTLFFDEKDVSDAALARDNVPPWFSLDDDFVPVDGESRNVR